MEGLRGQRQLGAHTKGGHLSHGGFSSASGAPEGSPQAQPWHLPLCAPQGQGRP